MLKVNIKTNKSFRLFIPVPYLILHVGCSIVTSNFVWKKISKAIAEQSTKNKSSFLPTNNRAIRQMLKQTIREVESHRGLVLVEANLQDGTKVKVTL